MISSLSLRHFQSHKKTDIEFSPGVNVIIGSSNSGKTSILRALYWAVYNRPSGVSFVSHWNRDKKDNPIKPTRVSVINDSTIISRIRSQELNGYEIGTEGNEQKLEAIGMDVPDTIQTAFNLDAVNIQRQMDAPFLLSESAADVARFFNGIIRLDLIDRVLGKAESKRRENNKEKIRLEQEQKTIAGEIELFHWIEDAEKITEKISSIEQRMIANRNAYEAIAEMRDNAQEYSETIAIQNKIVSTAPLVEKIQAFSQSLNSKSETLSRLQEINDSWKAQKKIIKGAVDFSKIEKMIGSIDEFRKQIFEKAQLRESIDSSLDDYRKMNAEKHVYGMRIIEAEKELPKICPLCGSKI